MRESKPEFEGKGGDRNPAADSGRVNARAECIIRDTSRASGSVNSNGDGDGSAIVIAKANGNELVDKKKSRANGETATAGFIAPV